MPVNDDKASTLMIGLTLETTREYMIRAILESLCYRFELLYETVLKETDTPLSKLIKQVAHCFPIKLDSLIIVSYANESK